MGCDLGRVTHAQCFYGTLNHFDHAVCNIVLHAQDPQCRATLPRRTKSRQYNIITDLFIQGRAIHHHHIDTTGFGDQRHNRAIACRQCAIDDFGCLG